MTKTNLMILLISLFFFTFFVFHISEPALNLWRYHFSRNITNAFRKRPKQVDNHQNDYTASLDSIPSVEENVNYKDASEMNSDIGKTSNHKNV